MVFRSLLFVPGARPDRFAKAAASGADAICIDLEDAVAPHLKAQARAQTLEWLEAPAPDAAIGLRVNALSTLDGYRDVVALADSRARCAFLMIPKPAGALEIANLRSALGSDCPPLWPLIESPEALYALPDIARAVGEKGGLMLGGADYSAALGSDMSFDALHHVRASIVAAAALVGCEAVDVPFLDVKDEGALRSETRRVKAMGFTGRAAIHPAQIAVINEVFSPTQEELTKAERIRAAYAAATGGVALLDGKLIEKPVLRAAERVLQSKGKG